MFADLEMKASIKCRVRVWQERQIRKHWLKTRSLVELENLRIGGSLRLRRKAGAVKIRKVGAVLFFPGIEGDGAVV